MRTGSLFKYSVLNIFMTAAVACTGFHCFICSMMKCYRDDFFIKIFLEMCLVFITFQYSFDSVMCEFRQ